MKILIDTHAFLWFVMGDSKLNLSAKKVIENSENNRFISLASLWEMAIKISIGKLYIGISFTELIKHHIYENNIAILQIKPEHLELLSNLPYLHRDPFDRLIIAQSSIENMPVLSKDTFFDDYSIQRIWA